MNAESFHLLVEILGGAVVLRKGGGKFLEFCMHERKAFEV
jgi:hypothetical protein